ncbi:MAG TPA: RluA family pseudouridine synthase [Alphaproteobacteria bacterium]
MTDTNATSVLIPDVLDNTRLDRALAVLLPDLSRARIQALIESGDVLIGGKALKASAKVVAGQSVSLVMPEPEAAEPVAEDIPLDIVYEDDDLLVLNKPAGLVVHPAAGHQQGTLVNALLHHCADSLSGIGGVKRPGIVHRLDKDTSGLMMVAKNDFAHQHLAKQLADRTLSRTYHALVWGTPMPFKGTIDAPLARNPNNRFFMAVRNDGRQAVTHYTVLERYGDTASLVECKLETGRTHQIRVHMVHKKNPLIGDPLYGLQPSAVGGYLKRGGYEGAQADLILGFPRQALHALKLSFIHPRTGNKVTLESELPNDFKELQKSLLKD